MSAGRSRTETRNSEAAALSTNLRRALTFGAVAAFVVFGGFLAYAFAAPATYGATAAIQLEPRAAARAGLTPSDAARRLREAVADAQLRDQLSRDSAYGKTPAERQALAQAALAAVDITSTDAHTFHVSARASEPGRAERLANSLAERSAARAPVVLAPEPSPEQRAREAAQKQRMAELKAFLAAHPELTAAPAAAPNPRRDEAADPALSALRAERADVEARLAAMPPVAPAPVENPYEDPSTLDPSARPTRPQDRAPEANLLRRRIAEINAAIQARRSALQQENGGRRPIPPELHQEWQRLHKAAMDANAEAKASAGAAAALSARVITRATVPTAPIEPDRPLLLLVGGMIALGVGVLLAVLLSAVGSRREALAQGHRTTLRAADGVFPKEARRHRSAEDPIPNALDPSPTRDHSSANVRNGSPGVVPEPIIGNSSIDPAMTTSEPNLVAQTPDSAGHAGRRAAYDLSRTLMDGSIEPEPELDAGNAPDGGQRSETTSSHPPAQRGQLVEVNAPLLAREGDALERVATVPHRVPRDALTRVTQLLGSPLPQPEDPQQAAGSAHLSRQTAQRSNTPPSSTSYSYVSTPAPAGAAASEPPPSPRRLRSHVSSRPPSSDRPLSPPLSYPSTPPLSSSPPSRSGQPVVSPRALSAPFQPDPALLARTRRELASELYPLAVEQCFVIGVTGLRKTGEETARVATEIALSLAETGHPRVLLLEGNLQRPAIQRWLHIELPMFSGFTEQLDARVQTGEYRPWTVLECTPSLHVLAEGVMRTPELILSPVFGESVRELRSYYDFIVIDGPLTSELAAYRALHEVVDGIVLVSPRGDSPELAQATALFSEKRFSTVLAAG